jgi:DNA-binding transcriptional LysR family regulator
MTSDIRLRYLYESARLGTMRAASDKLDVATSSVSRQIAELENELGLALIEKSRRRIKLTDAGEAACMYYKEKLSHEEAFLSKIEELKSIRTGKILFAVSEAFVTRQFSDMLQDYMQKYTGVTVKVVVANTNEVVELVREDEVHLGLIFDTPNDPKIRSRLTLPQPLKVVVNKSHAFSRRKSIKLEELLGERIGLPVDTYRMRQTIQVAEQEEGVFLESSMLTNSLALIADFVKSGKGISIMPEMAVQTELLSGQLVCVPVKNKTLNLCKFSLITRVGRQLPIGAHRFLLAIEAFLKSGVGALQDGQN